MGELILDSLEIEGFRAFERLTIERLSRVNLIVGKNNVGKSCLLEALQLYAHRGSPKTVWSILTARDEADSTNKRTMDDYVEAVKYLFYGRKLFDKYPDDDTFTIGTLDNPDLQLTVKVQWVEQTVTNLPGISITFGGETVVSAQLNNFLGGGYFSPRSARRGEGINCRFVSANSLDEDTLIEFWDNVALKPAEKDILQGIHIIAPEVERVNFLGREREHGSTRIPMVKMLDIAEPIPLRSLGEGMMRLFGIVLALVNAQNGLLLIDEVDSGLHYTVYSALWQLVFKIAARLNVQVFATTHSWDCVAGFQQAFKEREEEEGGLIHLERRQGHIVPILFDQELVNIAVRQQLEVR